MKFDLEQNGAGEFVLRGGGSTADGGMTAIAPNPGDDCGDVCWSFARSAEAPEGDIHVRSCTFVTFDDGRQGAYCEVEEAETCPGYVPGA